MSDRWEDQFIESYAEVRPEEFDEFYDAEEISEYEQLHLDTIERAHLDEFEDDDLLFGDEEEEEDYLYDINDELE